TANAGTFELTGAGAVATTGRIGAGSSVTQNGAGTTMAGTVTAPLYTLSAGTMSGTVNVDTYAQSGGLTSGGVNATEIDQSGGTLSGTATVSQYGLSGGSLSGTANTDTFELTDTSVVAAEGHIGAGSSVTQNGAGTMMAG